MLVATSCPVTILSKKPLTLSCFFYRIQGEVVKRQGQTTSLLSGYPLYWTVISVNTLRCHPAPTALSSPCSLLVFIRLNIFNSSNIQVLLLFCINPSLYLALLERSFFSSEWLLLMVPCIEASFSFILIPLTPFSNLRQTMALRPATVLVEQMATGP